MNEMIWDIKCNDLDRVSLNIGHYTSIYNEHDTKEEDILQVINDYFQKRNSNKNEVIIFDDMNQETVSYASYQSWILNHELVEREHGLASNAILTKKILRNLGNHIEIGSYFNSINALHEDVLSLIKSELPICIKKFDFKAFIKLLEFHYEICEDYDRLIVRLEKILPILVEEMNAISGQKTLLIYFYPEANLSPKEQVRFRKCLENLAVPIIVLTGSMHFLSNELEHNNYLRNGEQMLTSSFINQLCWDAPLNFNETDIKQSLNQFIHLYQEKLELLPTVTNYKLGDIMLFEPIDLYVGITYLNHIGQCFELDIKYDLLNMPLQKYVKSFEKS
ncbi:MULTISPECIES: hypothetical protein [Staphylococcus]|uniref:Uncharacterized protein n=2 Tax=Staphylococcus agnetis TaxID=985762 RepID=A0A2T4MEF5_9STAP|nr:MULTISPECIES: hypothetical protein [Staphylococcus]NHM75981.1 hypothetical protein [Staphylococcus sp. 11007852]NHM92669.1 hypothetical protein [Staphylococcus sp. 10602379]NJH83526.1 hypothetical protein [Staphylococcus agnetis]NJI02161.1 hypothetical protein [Staphylococcus agnetis]NJI12825.1 hypothetical protein [Staphylococcus agnetis]